MTRYDGYDRETLIRTAERRFAFDWIKRIVDVVVASFALVILGPVMLALAAAIRVTMGGPILYRQERAGCRGRPFTIYKFRTLDPIETHCCGHPLACDGALGTEGATVGRFAQFLRRSGLDELPQLLSVLRGEMSLIGPRPLLVRYLPRYTPEQAVRHEVLPGITGWAQVNGRNDLSWEQRLALDVFYVYNRSVTLDVTIAWRSIAAIWRRERSSREGVVTAPEFIGQGIRSDLCPVTLGPVGSPVGCRGTGRAARKPA
jgi:sugar transferase EpsL